MLSTYIFYNMGIVRIIKPALFIYESVRIIALAFILMLFLPVSDGIPWLALAAPGALFPLMAMFIWLDISRYKAYLPLFMAGKCIGIFSLLGFSIVSSQFTMIKGFSGITEFAELLFLSGDLLAFAGVFYIFKSMHRLPASGTEDKQCE